MHPFLSELEARLQRRLELHQSMLRRVAEPVLDFITKLPPGVGTADVQLLPYYCQFTAEKPMFFCFVTDEEQLRCVILHITDNAKLLAGAQVTESGESINIHFPTAAICIHIAMQLPKSRLLRAMGMAEATEAAGA